MRYTECRSTLFVCQHVAAKRRTGRATRSLASVSVLPARKVPSANSACRPTTTGTSFRVARYHHHHHRRRRHANIIIVS